MSGSGSGMTIRKLSTRVTLPSSQSEPALLIQSEPQPLVPSASPVLKTTVRITGGARRSTAHGSPCASCGPQYS